VFNILNNKLMPSYWDENFEDFNQEWEPVIIKKSDKNESNQNESSVMPVHRKISNARSNNNYTVHEFAQLIHMKVNDYIKLETGKIEPNSQQLAKIRKYLGIKI